MKKLVKVQVPVYLIVDEKDDLIQLDIQDGKELQFISDLESDAAIEYQYGRILYEEEL